MKLMTKSLFTMAVVAGAVSVSEQAEAAERKHSAFFCKERIEDRGEMDVESQYDPQKANGVRNRSSGVNWRRRGLYCPVLTDHAVPLSGVTGLDVDGFDGDAGVDGIVLAYACVSWRWANGADCGAAVPNGAPNHYGPYTMQFRLNTPGNPLNFWRNQSWDYPYVYVSLPGVSAGSSNLAGYTFIY